MTPTFKKLAHLHQSDEFLQSFCQKTLVLLNEFQSQYGEAIQHQMTNELNAITHKISSTMLWLELNDFVQLITSYKKVRLADRQLVEKLLDDVHYHTGEIKSVLLHKINELSKV